MLITSNISLNNIEIRSLKFLYCVHEIRSMGNLMLSVFYGSSTLKILFGLHGVRS
jgi:hypothetical protein